MVIKKTLKKKFLNAINGSCDKFTNLKNRYETFKIRNLNDKRKKKILCRKSKDNYHILLRACPKNQLTKNELKKILSNLGFNINGTRADLCHRLFLYELNNYPSYICNKKILNKPSSNNFIFKNPLDNRYHCTSKKKLKNDNYSYFPEIVQDYIKSMKK